MTNPKFGTAAQRSRARVQRATWQREDGIPDREPMVDLRQVRPAAWLHTVPSVSSMPFASLVSPNGLTDSQTVSVPLYTESDVALLVEAERLRIALLVESYKQTPGLAAWDQWPQQIALVIRASAPNVRANLDPTA
jgi:hypothetical protein